MLTEPSQLIDLAKRGAEAFARGTTAMQRKALAGTLSDEEIRLAHKTDPAAWHVAVDSTYRGRIKAALDTKEPAITHAWFNEFITERLSKVVGETIVLATQPLLDRIRVLEAAVRELRTAPGSDLPALDDIRELLAAPVVPVRDEKGKLVAAQRVLPPTPEEKLAELEHHVKSLEARPTVQYKGAWSKDVHYPAGSMTTHNGSVWYTEIASTGCRPGDGNAMWKLAVKGTR